MEVLKKKFDTYRIWYSSGHPYEAHIYCYQESTYVGRLVFYKDDASIPQNLLLSGVPSIHFAISRFNDVVSILREERPLFIHINLSNWIGYLATDEKEPVGEGES